MSHTCLLPAGRLALLFAMLAATTAQAAGSCQPARMFNSDRALVLHQSGTDLGVRLQAVLARDLVVPLDRELDPAATAHLPAKLQHPLPVRDVVLGRDALKTDAGSQLTVTSKGGGSLVAANGDLHYLVRIHDGKAKSVDGEDLQLQPPTASAESFTVMKDSTIIALSSATMTISAGSRVEWTMDGTDGLPIRLGRPARLEQTASAPGGGGELVVERPVSVLAGGKMQVRLTAPNVDLQSRPPIFCLYLPKADQPVLAEQVRVVKLEKNYGVYEIRVPSTWEYRHGEGGAVADLEQDGEIFWLNRRAALRAMVFDGDRVVLDVQRRFPLSRALVAVAVGLGLLMMLFLISGVFLDHSTPAASAALTAANPARTKVRESMRRRLAYATSLLGRLIQQPDGRYSLSNLQIMLWTVLVIFALTYVWVSTGEVLVLSNGILVLLGISGGTSVLARFLQPEGGTATRSSSAGAASVKDLVTSQGAFDLLRFQMLGFTLFTWVYSLVSVLLAEGLPEIPPSLYGLLGISNGTYLGGKLQQKWTAEDGTAAPASATPGPSVATLERTLTEDQVRKLQEKVGAPVTGKIDPPTRDAVTRYKAQNGIVPANGGIDDLLAAKLGL
jgi:hypothetical protein